MKSEDINFEERIIHVRGTKTKNADRLVPIHKDILPIVERRLGGWFERMNYQSFLKLHYTKFLANLGIKHTPHALRHTFVSIADSHDVNQIALKRIVGHANATMTDHYTHKDRTDLLNLIDCLDFVTYLSLTDIKL